ncbi:stage II sporulation protein P [Pradoshia eiseniae]|uniref:Stage II sporulation protein P n=1 Tax=Pradoshia eiseniae TaxID=2064768 RepID=A0A2S7MX75_9BACI|nr:stage II sporulation protein P [Pradoshia eiseniae]PQD94394.1 stage II sporulation protein P [Pradoshia eiseniae]
MKNIYIIINITVIFFSLSFLLIALITISSYKITPEFINSYNQNTNECKICLLLIKDANKNLIDDNTIESISLTEESFKVITSIDIEDPRTFLGRELPAFHFFDTKIQVAGIGTDYTTLPNESPPPIEEVLKERQINETEITKQEKTTKKEQDNNSIKKTTQGRKVVYLYHSHSWEAFLPSLKNAEVPDEATSTDENVNIISVGSKLKQALEEKGIGTDHNKTNVAKELSKRGWNTNQSYQYSRGLVTDVLSSNKDINYLIDIHRDSLRKKNTTVNIKNKSYARLFFIIGEDSKNFEKNLKLSKELHEAIEKVYPGLSKGVFSKNKTMGNGVYNQDLSENAILLEVGGVDNNTDELNNTIQAFAEVFSQYYWKTSGAKEI